MREFIILICLLFVVSILLYHFDESNSSLPTVEKVNDIPVVIIDGCEYLKNRTYYGSYVYTHKGNCKNPIHQYNKE